MKTMLPNLVLFLFLLFSASLFSQSNQSTNDTLKKITTPLKKATVKEFDTNESLIYMSERLLFQVKKRLHLTTEEEEKKEKEESQKQKKVILTIAGIKIER